MQQYKHNVIRPDKSVQKSSAITPSILGELDIVDLPSGRYVTGASPHPLRPPISSSFSARGVQFIKLLSSMQCHHKSPPTLVSNVLVFRKCFQILKHLTQLHTSVNGALENSGIFATKDLVHQVKSLFIAHLSNFPYQIDCCGITDASKSLFPLVMFHIFIALNYAVLYNLKIIKVYNIYFKKLDGFH